MMRFFERRRPRAFLLRRLVGDSRFTVISNNCWGAHIYQALGIQYQTPFVGLFIPPKSYLHLLRRFDECIRSDLSFTTESSSSAINVWRERERFAYPIGLLEGCVEIHFLHYSDENAARSKWQRRCQRITQDRTRWFFKFDDRENASADDVAEFCDLPLPNKVCFTASSYGLSTIVVPGEPGEMQVSDGIELSKISYRCFNALRWVSTLPHWVPLPSMI